MPRNITDDLAMLFTLFLLLGFCVLVTIISMREHDARSVDKSGNCWNVADCVEKD